METKKIFTINNVDIVVTDDNFVPIKPICEALGVAYERQFSKLKEDEDFSSVITLRVTTGADGKQYEMVCLPHQLIYGWLFTINPKNVKPEAKETVRKYRMECFWILYNHFHEQEKRRVELDKTEKKLMDEVQAWIEKEKEGNELSSNAKKERRKAELRLEEWRKDKFSGQLSLFQ